MTASPIAGQVADVPPAAVADQPPAPPEAPVPVAEESPGEEKRRRRKAFVLFFLLGLLALLIGLIIWYLLFRQPLPIIPPIPETQVPAYSTSFYEVTRPVGVAVSAAGDRIYVAQSEGDRSVAILDGSGAVIGAARPPATTGTDHVPVYVAIDPLTEEVYVTDRPAAAIYIYDRDGRFQRQFEPAVERVGWQPLGIAFDSAGQLYVTDLAGDQEVVVFDRQGQVVRTIGADAALNFPNGVAVDGQGHVYVTDSNNGRLLVFDAAGALVGKIGRGTSAGQLGLPRGVSVDPQGRVVVIDTTGNAIVVYRTVAEGAAKPEYLGVAGSEGIGNGQFEYPNGVATDGRGRVYVADTMNDRIQVWSY
jgi:DNA-binding beta-propeller fold protein YncE